MLRQVVFITLLIAGVANLADPEWESFTSTYKKVYRDASEEQDRYKVFQESKRRIAQLNMLNGEEVFGINFMSDRYELERFKKGLRRPDGFVPTAPVKQFTSTRSPKSIDWRLTDAVTAVKNQGQCGSCWAFSATEAIESAMVVKTGGLYRLDLSPQQINSCTPSTGAHGCFGCNGGTTVGAYEYVMSAPGLANSFFIPYEQSLTESTATKACPTAKVNAINGPLEQLQGGYAQVTGYSYATPPCTQGACTNQDLNALAAALEQSPVSVCVNAGVWNDYTGGVLTAAACGSMGASDQDHCVMAVGYNTSAPTPYWIVRNSWSSTFGEQGYIYLEMAKNTCGLADDATIPDVAVDLSDAQAKDVDALREDMYERATQKQQATPVVV